MNPPSFLTPPPWLVREMSNRLVLLLNHVLQQEPQAMTRLARHKGQSVRFSWQQISLPLTATPVGLLALASEDARIDLEMAIAEPTLLDLGKKVVQGQTPKLRIEGDVQLAAQVQWLIQHVRWDAEQDLARVVGDALAVKIVQTVSTIAKPLKAWLQERMPNSSGSALV